MLKQFSWFFAISAQMSFANMGPALYSSNRVISISFGNCLTKWEHHELNLVDENDSGGHVLIYVNQISLLLNYPTINLTVDKGPLLQETVSNLMNISGKTPDVGECVCWSKTSSKPHKTKYVPL